MPADRLVYQCPVDAPVEVLGGKWKLVLAFYLLQAPRRNGELRRLVPTISQKMLTQQLRELESDGIVVRTVYEQVPPRVDYAIADDERDRLQPLVDALFDWGMTWAKDHDAVIDSLETSCHSTGPDDPATAGSAQR